MASSTGFNREAGPSLLTDFDHVRQSITVILTTPIGSLLMLREFGSEVFELIDRPISDDRVRLALYAACVTAIGRWEPRYRITRVQIVKADATGVVEIVMRGAYMPRGHLGDFTIANDDAEVVVPFRRAA